MIIYSVCTQAAKEGEERQPAGNHLCTVLDVVVCLLFCSHTRCDFCCQHAALFNLIPAHIHPLVLEVLFLLALLSPINRGHLTFQN